MFFPETIIKVITPLIQMQTVQPKINLWDTPEKYNGWTDWQRRQTEKKHFQNLSTLRNSKKSRHTKRERQRSKEHSIT